MIVVFILSALWRIRIRGLWKLPGERNWLWVKLGLVLMDGAMLSKFLIQFSVDGWSCIPSLLFDLRPTLSAPDPKAGLPDLPETLGDSQASLGQSPVRSLFLSPGSWCAQGFVCALPESVSPVLWKFCDQIPLASKIKFPAGSQSLCQIPRLGNLLWVLKLS